MFTGYRHSKPTRPYVASLLLKPPHLSLIAGHGRRHRCGRRAAIELALKCLHPGGRRPHLRRRRPVQRVDHDRRKQGEEWRGTKRRAGKRIYPELPSLLPNPPPFLTSQTFTSMRPASLVTVRQEGRGGRANIWNVCRGRRWQHARRRRGNEQRGGEDLGPDLRGCGGRRRGGGETNDRLTTGTWSAHRARPCQIKLRGSLYGILTTRTPRSTNLIRRISKCTSPCQLVASLLASYTARRFARRTF